MPINFTCTCGKTINADYKYAGLKVKCPKCKSTLQVPDGEFEILPPPEITPPDRGAIARDAKKIKRGLFDPTAPSKQPTVQPGKHSRLKKLRKASGGKSFRRRHRRDV